MRWVAPEELLTVTAWVVNQTDLRRMRLDIHVSIQLERDATGADVAFLAVVEAKIASSTMSVASRPARGAGPPTDQPLHNGCRPTAGPAFDYGLDDLRHDTCKVACRRLRT